VLSIVCTGDNKRSLPQATLIHSVPSLLCPHLLIRPPELWKSYQQSYSSKAVERGNYFAHKVSLPYFEGFFNMPQNLLTLSQQLYFTSKEVCCRLLTSKIHHLWLGLNPHTFDPMASMLTTSSLRTTDQTSFIPIMFLQT
jgi:hypothetical protein